MRPAPDLSQAQRFLRLLELGGSFTFQTFADQDNSASWPTVVHGSLDEHAHQLSSLNEAGAGIFVMVNAGDGTSVCLNGRTGSCTTRCATCVSNGDLARLGGVHRRARHMASIYAVADPQQEVLGSKFSAQSIEPLLQGALNQPRALRGARAVPRGAKRVLRAWYEALSVRTSIRVARPSGSPRSKHFVPGTDYSLVANIASYPVLRARTSCFGRSPRCSGARPERIVLSTSYEAPSTSNSALGEVGDTDRGYAAPGYTRRRRRSSKGYRMTDNENLQIWHRLDRLFERETQNQMLIEALVAHQEWLSRTEEITPLVVDGSRNSASYRLKGDLPQLETLAA